eukprot:GHVN01028927.1.p1 GENE.GHVN01028927.1~~GHVN01028927.1.p1  ORF type:complete len:613 (+),score=174.54 GHVN01028927.1:692-2530(+)
MMIFYDMRHMFRPGLPGLKKRLSTLQALLTEREPEVLNHMTYNGVQVQTMATDWLLTLFAHSIPIGVLAELWDQFFDEGWVCVYRLIVHRIARLGTVVLMSYELMDLIHVLKFSVPPKQKEPPGLLMSGIYRLMGISKPNEDNQDKTPNNSPSRRSSPVGISPPKGSSVPQTADNEEEVVTQQGKKKRGSNDSRECDQNNKEGGDEWEATDGEALRCGDDSTEDNPDMRKNQEGNHNRRFETSSESERGDRQTHERGSPVPSRTLSSRRVRAEEQQSTTRPPRSTDEADAAASAEGWRDLIREAKTIALTSAKVLEYEWKWHEGKPYSFSGHSASKSAESSMTEISVDDCKDVINRDEKGGDIILLSQINEDDESLSLIVTEAHINTTTTSSPRVDVTSPRVVAPPDSSTSPQTPDSSTSSRLLSPRPVSLANSPRCHYDRQAREIPHHSPHSTNIESPHSPPFRSERESHPVAGTSSPVRQATSGESPRPDSPHSDLSQHSNQSPQSPHSKYKSRSSKLVEVKEFVEVSDSVDPGDLMAGRIAEMIQVPNNRQIGSFLKLLHDACRDHLAHQIETHLEESVHMMENEWRGTLSTSDHRRQGQLTRWAASKE